MLTLVESLALLLTAFAFESPVGKEPPAVQEFRSPSGEWKMTTQRSEAEPLDEMGFALERVGDGAPVLVWSAKLPLRVVNSETLTDAGCFFGFDFRCVPAADGKGTRLALVAVGLGPDGKTVIDDVVDKTGGWPDVHSPQGLIVHETADRVVFRVSPALEVERWQPYAISDGARLDSFEPAALQVSGGTLRPLLCAIAIPNEPLWLVRWELDYPERPDVADAKAWTAVGTRIAVITTRGEPVWHLDVPGDVGGSNVEQHSRHMDTLRKSRDCGLSTKSRGEGFTVRLIAASKDARFALARNARGSWTVTEESPTVWRGISLQGHDDWKR